MWILCLAEDSLKTSSLIFSEKKTMKKYLWKSSAAVGIGALRAKTKQISLTIHQEMVYLHI